MREIPFETVDVFTTERFTGNPLAVIPDAQGLSAAEMQRIAAEFNYAETTFVLPPRDAGNTAWVRIFTPGREIPFAGHPNVGTAFVLGSRGSVFGRALESALRFEEGAGLVTVALLREGQAVSGAQIKAPKPLEVLGAAGADVVADCVGLDRADIAAQTHPPTFVSVGLSFLVAETSLDALRKARPDAAAFAAADRARRQGDDRLAVFLYARVGVGTERVRARMFAPLHGIQEDPATGSASAALGAFLASLARSGDAETAMVVEQGVEMGRPSTIHVAVRKQGGAVREVAIAGSCVPVMRGVIELP